MKEITWTPSQLCRPSPDILELIHEVFIRCEGLESEVDLFESSDYSSIYSYLYGIRQEFFTSRPVFYEWGSGSGVISMMAGLLGYSSTGIEIESRLCDTARQLAEDYRIPATFICDDCLRTDPLTQEAVYLDCHVLFAYPWPNEENAYRAFIAKHCRPRFIYIEHLGIENTQLYSCE